MAAERRSPHAGAPAGRAGLEVLGQAPAERADAARNRRKILDVAARLAARDGVDSLAMDEVARGAGVGVGTVYRRFGDRAGLILALIDHDEQDFQHRFLYGPPPLGPGADAPTRIRAFLHAMVRRIRTHGEFMIVAETTGPAHVRYGRAYSLHHMHLTALLAEAAPAADAPWLADTLLATVSATLVTYQLDGRGMPVGRVEAGLDFVLDAVLGADRPVEDKRN